MPGKKTASDLAATVCWAAQNETRAGSHPTPDVCDGAQAVMMLTLQAVLTAHAAGELDLDGATPESLLEALAGHFADEAPAPAKPKGLMSKAVTAMKKFAGGGDDVEEAEVSDSAEEVKPSAKKAGRPPKAATAAAAPAKSAAKPVTPKPVSAAKPAAKPVSAAKPAAPVKAGGDAPKKPGRPPKAVAH